MKFRKLLKITGRTSSITNSFVQSIIPTVEPSQQEVDEALNILDMTRDDPSCVYCGIPATDWDHLRPLVKKKRPTGYINEIRNLVPACGKCNQSKSGAEWRVWMESSAKGGPKSRGVKDLAERIVRLERFVEWGGVKPVDIESLVDAKLWDTHWQNLTGIERSMKEAQEKAFELQSAIRIKFLEMRRQPN